jgi:ribosomal protein S6
VHDYEVTFILNPTLGEDEVTANFRTSPAAAHGLDAQIKLNDNVLRHLVIRLDPSKT